MAILNSTKVLGDLAVTGQIASTVVTGTTPMLITSTTKVANLNADLLDDMSAATANTASTIVARDASTAINVGAVTSTGIISAAGYKTVDGAYNAPAYTFISAPTTGLFIPAAGELGFTVSGAEKLKLTGTATISTVNLQAPDIFLTDNNLYLGNLATDLKYNGIPDAEKSKWVLSYDAASKVFSVQITSASYYYVDGKRFDLPAATYAWPAHAATNGIYYFYFDATGGKVTSAVNTVWDIIETAQVAYVIYNSANDGGAAAGLLGYELHGCIMSSAVHKYEHLTNGTELISLGALSGYTLSTSTAAAISWALASTQIADEDIFMSGIAQAESNYTLGYFDATNNFHWRVSATIPIFKGPNNIIQYNPNGSGLVELSSNNDYVNYYIALTTGNDSTKRVIVLPGQAKYTTLAAAEQETPVNFNHGTLPFQEIVIAYRITYKYTAAGATEAGKAQIAATPKIITFNNSSIAAASGSHALLSNRDATDSHPASAITNIPAGNIAATDVQSALNELDSEKLALAGGTMTGTITSTYGSAILTSKATGYKSWVLHHPANANNFILAPSTAADGTTWDWTNQIAFYDTGEIVAKRYNSNIATGTSPLVIASTTLVNNLNADLWDGYHFADYLNQAVKTTSSPTFAGTMIISGGSFSPTLPDFGSTNFGGIILQGGASTTTTGLTFGYNGYSSAQAGVYVKNDSGAGTTMYLATTNSYATGPIQRLTIAPDGKVIIGTGTPSQLLDVQGNIAIAGNKLGGGKNYGNPSNSNDATLEMYNVGTGNTTLNNIGFSIDLQTASTSRLFIKNNGYIGIGTTAPTTALHIASDSNDILTVGNKTNTNEQVIIGFNSTSNYGYISAIEQGVAYRNLILNTYGGNVGIGTTTATTKLAVKGTISSWNSAEIKRAYTYYDDTWDAGVIGSVHEGVVYKNTLINPDGGNVGIGNTNPTAKLTVTGDVSITGTLYATAKSFLIDHPTEKGKKLQHGSLEGPENGVYFRGKLLNYNVIELPDYWRGLVDETTITVTLTAIGKSQAIWVDKIIDNKVYIKRGSLFNKKVSCFYTVYGERKDVEKLKVEL